jgi:hypothetical protein
MGCAQAIADCAALRLDVVRLPAVIALVHVYPIWVRFSALCAENRTH